MDKGLNEGLNTGSTKCHQIELVEKRSRLTRDAIYNSLKRVSGATALATRTRG